MKNELVSDDDAEKMTLKKYTIDYLKELQEGGLEFDQLLDTLRMAERQI